MGGDATLVHLPEIGIRGNTHFPFSDLNNQQIADLMSRFLAKKGLDLRRVAPGVGRAEQENFARESAGAVIYGMAIELAAMRDALEELTDAELCAPKIAANEAPQNSHLPAWIEGACDWEINRRLGRRMGYCRLRP